MLALSSHSIVAYTDYNRKSAFSVSPQIRCWQIKTWNWKKIILFWCRSQLYASRFIVNSPLNVNPMRKCQRSFCQCTVGQHARPPVSDEIRETVLLAFISIRSVVTGWNHSCRSHANFRPALACTIVSKITSIDPNCINANTFEFWDLMKKLKRL